MRALADKRSFYIPNCCDEEAVANLTAQDRADVRQRLGIPPHRFVVICLASIQYHKGQDLLLDCLPTVLSKVPDILIYFVGPQVDHVLAMDLRQRIELGELDEHVRILGNRRDALEFIYAADLLVTPSRTEAMPLTILEAMALKTPVIASDVGGIPELIENEVTGLLFPPEQPMRLADALVRAAKDPVEQRSFAERASQRYWSSFSKVLHAKRYAQAIEEMLK